MFDSMDCDKVLLTMKKKLPISILLSAFSLLVVSCNNSSAMHYNLSETDTIRHEALTHAENIIWTDTFQNSEDTQNRTVPKDIFNEQLSLSFGPKTTMVYPEIEGFGSLDTSAITPPIQSSLSSFLTAIKGGTVPSSVFDPSFAFAAVVAQYQLSQIPDTFSDFITGRPFIGDDGVYEIPVLAIAPPRRWIFRIYLDPQKAADNQFKVQQVSFEELTHE